MGSLVAHQHADLELLGPEFARKRLSPHHKLATDAAAAMGRLHDQIRDIRIGRDPVVCGQEHLPQYADEPDHRTVCLCEKYAPAVLLAVPENLRQVGISRLFGCWQPRLKTLFPCLKLDEARAQRRIIRGWVILANEDHGGKSVGQIEHPLNPAQRSGPRFFETIIAPSARRSRAATYVRFGSIRGPWCDRADRRRNQCRRRRRSWLALGLFLVRCDREPTCS